MTNDKGIFIKNIYYMLAYAFQVLRQKNYDNVAAEDFDNVQDLFAAILAKGVSQQIKQGLYREYITKNEDLSILRGKLGIYGTIKNQIQRKMLLSCEYDELSVNNIFNQILKTMITSLLWSDTTFGIWSGLSMEIQRIKYICCWILRIVGEILRIRGTQEILMRLMMMCWKAVGDYCSISGSMYCNS